MDSAVISDSQPTHALDYYLIFGESDDLRRMRPSGIFIEEFALHDDYTAAGLDSAGWTRERDAWWSSAAFSRGIRIDPLLRGRVVPTDRVAAEAAYRLLARAELPGETTLRTFFLDRELLPSSAPLRLHAERVPPGFAAKRVYRILFTKNLDQRGLARLQSLWQLEAVDDATDPQARVLGRAQRVVADHAFTWELRRIGLGVAWSVDVTACLGISSVSAIGALLRDLTLAMRQQGLIAVTIERFV
jgi:hypothetical protein